MEIKEILVMYPVTLAIFLSLDFLWLALVAKSLYFKELKSIVLSKDGKNISARILPAGIFYFLFVAGILFFVLKYSVDERSLWIALLNGCFFGLFTYGTYDLTNYSVLKDWSLTITIVDIIWGVVLSSSVSVLSYLFYVLIF